MDLRALIFEPRAASEVLPEGAKARVSLEYATTISQGGVKKPGEIVINALLYMSGPAGDYLRPIMVPTTDGNETPLIETDDDLAWLTRCARAAWQAILQRNDGLNIGLKYRVECGTKKVTFAQRNFRQRIIWTDRLDDQDIPNSS